MNALAQQSVVLREQVAALYASSWTSTLADTLLAWAMCAVFYWRLRDPSVLLWAGLHFLQLLRYPLLGAYHRDPRAAERSQHWARLQCRELLIYSSVWGLAPWLFMPANDLPMTVLLMLVMLGLCSAGVPAVAPRWPSVLCFVVPMVVGLITAMAWYGDLVHWFMAACCGIYLGATLHFARQQNRLLTEALQMRFEKQSLAERLELQMQESERLSEEKTRFFAAASHDLRQPLHAITLFGAVLEKSLSGRPEQVHAARLMESVRALGVSLDTMMDVSRIDSGVIVPERQAVTLNVLFQQINAVFSPLAEQKGLQLRLRASPLAVISDPHLLYRMVVNLVENAIKYTPRGGVLVVARSRQSQVWIDVCDTGIGISDDEMQHIFDEFYQANNPGRDRSMGSGLGLSIVRRLSLLLDHPVSVFSRPKRGSRFRLTLPMAASDTTKPDSQLTTGAIPLAPLPGIAAQDLPKRVMLLDDEVEIGYAMAALLKSYGVELTVVRDEMVATDAFIQAAMGRPFDALIFDYRLAGGADGLAVAQRLCNRFDPQLPKLMVTGETAPQRLQLVREMGVDMLQKPTSTPDLLAALRRLKRLS
jgi:signal transduction histidine kinase/ActR/RegA family two-component response regulator